MFVDGVEQSTELPRETRMSNAERNKFLRMKRFKAADDEVKKQRTDRSRTERELSTDSMAQNFIGGT